MKIALLNPWTDAAENQASATIARMAATLGHIAIECQNSDDILRCEPDFVLAMASVQPKLTHYTTYVLLHQPRQGWLRNADYLRNFFTYDGYFTISNTLSKFASHLLYAARRKDEIGYFYNTSMRMDWDEPISFSSARLAYFGTNWDSRRPDLFTQLDRQPWMEIYGPEHSWAFLDKTPQGRSFKGPVPFDGISVLNTYRSAGIGLCLLSEEHLADNIISNRIFEISAAGAISIAPRMPWLQENFGDSLLYIDQEAPAPVLASQITEHVSWVRSNPDEAAAKANKAYELFNERFSLEVLLPKVTEYHLRRQRRISQEANQGGTVSVIVRCGGRPISILKRAISSIAAQEHRPIQLVIVTYREIDPYEAIEDLQRFSSVRIVKSIGAIRSTALWNGLAACTGDYIAILDDDDEWMTNHLSSLVVTLQEGQQDLAYSGSVRHYLEPFLTEQRIEEHRALSSFPIPPLPSGLIESLHTFPINSYLFRRSLLDEWILIDPEMTTAEDSYLMLSLLQKATPRFTYRATAIHYESPDPSDFPNDPNRAEDLAKLRLRFYGRQFPPSPLVVDLEDISDIPLRKSDSSSVREWAGVKEYLLPPAGEQFGPEETWLPVPLTIRMSDVRRSGKTRQADENSLLPLIVEPVPQPWAYGLELPIVFPNDSPHIVQLRVRITSGRAGFGVLTLAEDDFSYRVFVSAEDKTLVVNLPVLSPADTGRVVIQTTDGFRPLVVELEDVAVFAKAQDSAALPVPNLPPAESRTANPNWVLSLFRRLRGSSRGD